MNAISTASAGMLSAASRYDQASANLSNAVQPNSTQDPAAAIVDQIQAKTQFEASAKTLQVADQMFQSTLDILV